jgi:aspartyl aminopeptidase
MDLGDPWHEIMSEGEMIGRLLAFLDASPSPYHAVSNLSKRLGSVGFHRLDEGGSWEGAVQAGGKYYFTRNGSAMVAFAIGKKYVGTSHIGIISLLPCRKQGMGSRWWQPTRTARV